MYQVVVPTLYLPWAGACLQSCRFDKDKMLIIDNSQENKGVARSWNMGLDAMQEQAANWLILCSEANRFGARGGLDFIDELDPDYDVVEAGLGMGWHLIAFHRRVFEVVGRFDENFYPGYFEDVDFHHRMELALPQARYKRPVIDMMCAGWGHVPTLTNFAPRVEDIKSYIISKWGGLKEREYTYPFNKAENSVKYWPYNGGSHWDD